MTVYINKKSQIQIQASSSSKVWYQKLAVNSQFMISSHLIICPILYGSPHHLNISMAPSPRMRGVMTSMTPAPPVSMSRIMRLLNHDLLIPMTPSNEERQQRRDEEEDAVHDAEREGCFEHCASFIRGDMETCDASLFCGQLLVSPFHFPQKKKITNRKRGGRHTPTAPKLISHVCPLVTLVQFAWLMNRSS
jgi:hypothetical protein